MAKKLLMAYIVVMMIAFGYAALQTAKPVQASQPTAPQAQLSGGPTLVTMKLASVEQLNHSLRLKITKEERVNKLRQFFKAHNSPLAANARDFVEAADLYDIDWRLLPAISMVESSGGKHLFKSYNPFGWGKHGYSSFRAAIYDVARGMANGYYAKGADTPYEIAKSYNPVTPQEWGPKVNAFMMQIGSR